MDGYQHPPRYVRPPPQQPPPSTMDHHHLYHQQQPPLPPPPRPPVPPQGQQWYPNQFHYQHPSSHSPSPPPPSQWAPPPGSSAYPAPPPPPYPSHNQNNLYPPPPRPHAAPPQISQSYPQGNQDWGNQNWAHHHQGWDYSSHNNAQDWAARAKEWASARAAMENQHPPSQFPPVGRPEEQAHSTDQYGQTPAFQYPETPQQQLPTSSYQQYQVPAVPPQQPPMPYHQEIASTSSGQSSYVPDVQLPYNGGDGASEANVGFPHKDSLHFSPFVRQQEVSSSYSPITGKEAAQEGQYHMHPSSTSTGTSISVDPPFAYGSQADHPPPGLNDQPLDFAPRFNHDHGLHMQSGYAAHNDSSGSVRGIDSVPALPSASSWTPPVAPGAVYPQIPPGFPSGPQHDPSITAASVAGPTAPQFGRFPGPVLQPSIPSAGAFGLASAFPGETYGVTNVPERPKKAPVPNWLKEEIIKNKAAITKPLLENVKEDTQSAEDDHRMPGKDEQADSKSFDSSKSTEEEDDDEDYVEAAKTAAINQEIKRILTEVLLKVTDDLFDEIATKVLAEDDVSIEVDNNTMTTSNKVSPPPPAVPTPKASAKVLVPVKTKEYENESASEKNSFSSPGDVLGLGNYASEDDDGDDEIQSSTMPNSRNKAVQNGSHVVKHGRDKTTLDSSLHKTSDGSGMRKLTENRVYKEQKHANPSSVAAGDRDDENDNTGPGSNEALGEDTGIRTGSELPDKRVSTKSSTNDNSQNKEARSKSIKNDTHESKKGYFGKDSGNTDSKNDETRDEDCRRLDKRQSRKEKTDDRSGSRDRTKDHHGKPDEKAKERKKSTHLDVKDDKKDAERHHESSSREDTDKRRNRSKEEDTSKHKRTSDLSRHKRRRSSSIGSRGRNSKDNSASHANDSSDETSDDSKRRSRSRRRNLSPSPVRSRRRQVSRSPHSKHSQRRHSPYSCLETTRGRRSRSRSPARRKR